MMQILLLRLQLVLLLHTKKQVVLVLRKLPLMPRKPPVRHLSSIAVVHREQWKMHQTAWRGNNEGRASDSPPDDFRLWALLDVQSLPSLTNVGSICAGV